ncbi:MAG: AbrB/MazE/SpoVT family DNA-binding domain-containing protein [Candidatus Hydrothermarchaeales archaeon]
MIEAKKKEIELTTTSPKGQVVIPKSIREKLNIKEGTKFAVYGRDDTIIFKKIEMPKIEDFESLVDFGVEFAKKKDIRKEDVLEGD